MSNFASKASLAPASEPALQELVEDFAARLERGEQLQIEEFVLQHPEHADQLRVLLPTMQALAEWGKASSEKGAGEHDVQEIDEQPVVGTLGDYRIMHEVGRGGMGVVYKAEQISLGRMVALKVLPFAATLDPRQLLRFQNEARAAASLDHPHIVKVHSVGCERGVHYYAMQFVEGQSVDALIQQMRPDHHEFRQGADPQQTADQDKSSNKPREHVLAADTRWEPQTAVSTLLSQLSKREYFRRIAKLGIQAGEALEHAHQSGVIHRDIKPANLMLDGRGNLWITDFGLAHFQTDAKLTMTGELVGTIRYMSPEQALAKRVVVDQRTDIYSMGATLYELMTLKPVFSGKDRQELLRQIAFEEPVSPRRVDRQVPFELETIVLKCLEKNPEDRYSSGKELAEDLTRFLKDEPTQARRPTLWRRGRKWSRRHVAAVRATAAAAFLVLLALAGMAGWWLNDRARREAETDRSVTAALDESYKWQRERKMPEALAAAKRAAATAASGAATSALDERVRSRLADLELVAKLEGIRLKRGITDPTLNNPQANHKQFDDQYLKAFHAFGIDVEKMSPEDAGQRIRQRSVAVEIAAILDDWFFLLNYVNPIPKERQNRLLQIARVADPDPWRAKVRLVLEIRDEKAIRSLIAEAKVEELSPSTIVILASALRTEKESQRLLMSAVNRYQDDFWLNWEIGSKIAMYLFGEGSLEVSLRYLIAAAALRPNEATIRRAIAQSYDYAGMLDDAIDAYRALLLLEEGNAATHEKLGLVFLRKGSIDAAIAEFRQACRLAPTDASIHESLGRALTQAGRFEEGVILLKEAARISREATKVEAREKSLEPSVAAAWENIGAKVGWCKTVEGGIGTWVEFKDPGEPMQMPAIRIGVLPPEGIGSLPVPVGPFALFLNAAPTVQEDEWVKQIARLKTLKLVSLGAGAVTSANLKALAELKCVECLSLEGFQLDGPAFKELGRMKTLQSLSINDMQGFPVRTTPSRVTDERIKHLAGLTELRSLALIDTQVTDQGLKELWGLKQLEYLRLSDSDVTDAGIAGLTALKHLNLSKTKITGTGLRELRQLRVLKFFMNPVTGPGMEEIGLLMQLETLHLSSAGVSDEELKLIHGLVKLRLLRLQNTPVGDEGLRVVGRFKELQMLSLVGTKVTDAGLVELRGLKQLKELVLNGTNITDAGLRELAGLKMLQSLMLGGTQVTDHGIKELFGLTQLQVLHLYKTKLTDVGLKDLAGMLHLQTLYVSDTKISDAGLKHIGGLLFLQSLELSRTQVTDVGLKELVGLQQLRTLNLNNTQVTSQGVAELREKLPAVKITWSGKK